MGMGHGVLGVMRSMGMASVVGVSYKLSFLVMVYAVSSLKAGCSNLP
jgi:hypothetical protein